MSTDAESALKAGDLGSNQRDFRRCLSQFATGVNIVTTQVNGVNAGVTANSFSSLSLEPPLVLWSLKRTSRSFDAFMSADKFSISILSMFQIDVAHQFASSSDNKFEMMNWYEGANGIPVIKDALGTLDCTTIARHDGGDHMLFIGQVSHFSRKDGEPLIFSQGRYGVVTDHPGTLKSSTPENGVEAIDKPTFSRLVFQAYRSLTSAFESNRRQENVTVSQHKVLTALFRHDALSTSAIADLMFLGERDAADATFELARSGLVQHSAPSSYALTEAGRKSRRSLARQLHSFEEKRLATFSQLEVEICSNVLRKLAGDEQLIGETVVVGKSKQISGDVL